MNNIFPFFGYAPGNYENTCCKCKEDIRNVDKLCFVCLECAIAASRQSAPVSGEAVGSEWKVGMKVKITKKKNGHQFKIGDIVTLVEFDPNDNDWCAEAKGSYSWVRKDEAELITPPPPDLQSIVEKVRGMKIKGSDFYNWSYEQACNNFEEEIKKLQS